MSLNNSFDDHEVQYLAETSAEFPESDELPVPIKKLSEEFDSVAKSDDSMKVYLRVRPISDKNDSTMSIESSNSIKTCAPDVSKRAQYTKLEERLYVSIAYGRYFML